MKILRSSGLALAAAVLAFAAPPAHADSCVATAAPPLITLAAGTTWQDTNLSCDLQNRLRVEIVNSGGQDVTPLTNGGFVTQGSSTANQLGPLVQGSVFTGIPPYVSGQTSPLVLSVGGSLHVGLYTPAGVDYSQSFNAPAGPSGAGLGVVGIFHATADTLTDGQEDGVQLDTAGNLHTVDSSAPVAVAVTPTISTSAYVSGYCLGGLQTIPGFARAGSANGSSMLQSVQVSDVSGQDAAIDLVIFNATPSSSTFTDHAACTVNTADVTKVIRVIHITDCTLLGASAPGACQATNLAENIVLGHGNTAAYAVAIVRSTPTYSASSNVRFLYKAMQD